MRHQPTGEQLLASAERLLRDRLLPVLPPTDRQAGLMIARAMAIAARQLRDGDDCLHDECAALRTLLDIPLPPPPPGLAIRLQEANRQLGQMIRAGLADTGARRQQVHACLLASVRRQLSHSNPSYLARQP